MEGQELGGRGSRDDEVQYQRVVNYFEPCFAANEGHAMSIQSPGTNPPYSTVVEMVRDWLAEQRLALAQHLLKTLERDVR